MIDAGQRGFMREIFYEFEAQVNEGFPGIEPQRMTDYFIDDIVAIYETGEPLPRGRWVKKLDGSQPEAEEG